MVKTVKMLVRRINKAGEYLLFVACAVIFFCPLALAAADTQPQALGTVGIYALREIDPTLTGNGVRVGVIARSLTYLDNSSLNDYQPNVDHRCFSHLDYELLDDHLLTPTLSPHSTAVCSILFGEDANAYTDEIGAFEYLGAIPRAHASVYELQHFLKEGAIDSISDLDVITISWGWDIEDWWTRFFEALAEHSGIPVVASIGNGENAFHRPLYPGASSNVIGVGVVDSVVTEDLQTTMAYFGLAKPEHSSCGPTDDGRSKPDLVAPGNCLVAGIEDVNAYKLTGNWSSFAAPVVSGVVGMLVQKAGQDPNLALVVSPQGGDLVIKALLMTSATKLPYWHKGDLGKEDDQRVPLDNIQGAGMVNAVGAYQDLIAGRQEPGTVTSRGWDLNLLDTEIPARIYEFDVNEPNQTITATVTWHRHYEASGEFSRLDDRSTDLRLELWAVDSGQTGADVLVDVSDSQVDNIEHIHSQTLAGYVRYQLVVLLNHEEAKDNDIQERYALSWNADSSEKKDSIFWPDLNTDGIVDVNDYQFLVDNFTARHPSGRYFVGDVNTDGRIDGDDLKVLLKELHRRATWYHP